MTNSTPASTNSRSKSRKSSFRLRRGTVVRRDVVLAVHFDEASRYILAVVVRKRSPTQRPCFDRERPHHCEPLVDGRTSGQVIAGLHAQSKYPYGPVTTFPRSLTRRPTACPIAHDMFHFSRYPIGSKRPFQLTNLGPASRESLKHLRKLLYGSDRLRGRPGIRLLKQRHHVEKLLLESRHRLFFG